MANSVEEAVYNLLASDTELMAAVDAVYWGYSTGTTYPYIVFWLVDDTGVDSLLGYRRQGESRIQFDIWDEPTPSGMARGVRVRSLLADKIRNISKTQSGYHLMTTGNTEQTIRRESDTEPHHFVVDGV